MTMMTTCASTIFRVSMVAVALLAASLVVDPASAGELLSPSFAGGDDVRLTCTVLYAGNKGNGVQVAIELFDRDLVSQTDVPFLSASFVLTPTVRSTFLSASCPGAGGCLTPYCRFVVEGKKGDYRATACIEGAEGNVRVTLACLEAR